MGNKRRLAAPKAFASSIETKRSRKRTRIKEEDAYSEEENLVDDIHGESRAVEFEDDEEIDEDGAFDEEDDIKFGNFFTGTNIKMDNLEEEDRDKSDFEGDPDAVDIMTLFNNEEDSKVKSFFQSSGKKSDNEEEDNSGEDTDVDLRILMRNSLADGNRKKRAEEIQVEAVSEGHLNVPINGERKLNIDRLLAAIDDSTVNMVKSKVKKLDKDAQKGITAAPLAPLLQEKLNREAAFKKSSEEVTKWLPFVQKNRQADHVKLNVQTVSQPPTNIFTLATKIKPQTSMEEEITQILEAAGVADEKQISRTEELTMKQLDPEMIKAQQVELQRMRSLLFYAEIKQKRAAKIKSKKYRKIKKKEKMRNEENLTEVGNDDSLDVERRRAEERMTLRHANSKGKFKFNHVNEEGREAIMERLKRHDLLMEKIKGDDDSDNEMSEAEADEVVKGLVDDIKNHDPSKEAKGVMGMKFMQKAMEAQKQAVLQELEGAEETSTSGDVDGDKGVVVGNNEGRITFGSNYSKNKSIKKSKEGNDEDNYYKKSSSDEEEENPWLETIHEPRSVRKISENQINAQNCHARAQKLEVKIQKKAARQQEKEAPVKVFQEQNNGDLYERVNLEPREISFDGQKNLIELAFADDDVIREFEQEKNDTVAGDAPKEVDITLPGWGSWSNQKPRRQFVKKIPGIEAKTRRDYKLKHVIINEAKDKKFVEKYQVSKLPFPHKFSASYEATMRTPVGKEWNTEQVFEKTIKPRVAAPVGKIILPPKLSKSSLKK